MKFNAMQYNTKQHKMFKQKKNTITKGLIRGHGVKLKITSVVRADTLWKYMTQIGMLSFE